MPLAELPQTNKQHAVPQNIMDVEFKLIGDLTLRQFIYLIVFGGGAYVSSVAVVGVFKWPMVIICVLLAVGLAFIPIQERGLDEWIVNFFRAINSPTQRIWKRELTIPSAFMHDNLALVKQELITLAPTSSRRRLEEYLEYKVASQVVDPLDIPQEEYVQKIRDAYADYVPQPEPIAVGVSEPGGRPVLPSQRTGLPSEPSEQDSESQEVQSEQMGTQDEGRDAEFTEGQAPRDQKQEKPGIKEQLKAQAQKIKENVHPSERYRQKKHKAYEAKKSADYVSRPMTPDMHSGRRFTNLVPKAGELILPIRGEKVIRTTHEVEIEEDIQEKAEKLQMLLAQITREKEGIVPPTVDKQQAIPQEQVQPKAQSELQKTPEAPEDLNTEAVSLAEKLKGETARLSTEINELETQKATAQSDEEKQEKDAQIRRLQVEKDRTHADLNALQQQLVDLQNKLKEKVTDVFSSSSKQSAGDGPAPVSSYTPIQNLSGKVNILTGSIKSKEGEVIENALLILKNEKGESVRAFKTDKLGQFKLTTPIANGNYQLEVIANNKGQSFDIITIEAKGGQIPFVELQGK